jgi:hypothetical protein
MLGWIRCCAGPLRPEIIHSSILDDIAGAAVTLIAIVAEKDSRQHFAADIS